MRLVAALPVLVLLLAALLAGCAGSASPGAPAAGDSSASDGGEQADAAQPAAPAASAASAQARARPAAVRTHEESLAYAGSSPVGGCTGVAGVTGTCQSVFGGDYLKELGSTGRIASLHGNLTWSATTSATEEMNALVLVPYSGCQGCWTRNSETPYASGPSPLRVDFDLSGFDEPLALWVSSYQGASAGVTWAGAYLPQDFAFDGVRVVLDP